MEILRPGSSAPREGLSLTGQSQTERTGDHGACKTAGELEGERNFEESCGVLGTQSRAQSKHGTGGSSCGQYCCIRTINVQLLQQTSP